MEHILKRIWYVDHDTKKRKKSNLFKCKICKLTGTHETFFDYNCKPVEGGILKKDTGKNSSKDITKYTIVSKDITKEEAKDVQENLDTKSLKNPQVSLKVITGGGGFSGDYKNWLLELPVGSIFLCKKRGDNEFAAFQFQIDWAGERGVLLSSNLPVEVELPVDSLGFSRAHELVEVQRRGWPNVPDESD